MLFSTTRKANTQGMLLPAKGIVRIVVGQAGVIKERHVIEGQFVRAGELLFVLSNERSGVYAETTEQTVSSLLRERRDSFAAELKQSLTHSRQRLALAVRRAEALSMEIARNRDQILLQKKRLLLAEQSKERFGELQASGYVSASQLQDKQADLLDQRQRLADLQRMQAASEREFANAKFEVGDIQMQGERDAATLNRNASVIQQDFTENEARRRILVRAPASGIVTGITAEKGQTVAANKGIASLVPAKSELEAEIYVPSHSVGFIKPGMQVMLRYRAYPYQKFGQHRAFVREVAYTSLSPEELNVSGATLPVGATAEPVYRIRLRLDQQTVVAYGKPLPLKPGMLVDASVVLEHRRLYEWVLEPLFSITGR